MLKTKKLFFPVIFQLLCLTNTGFTQGNWELILPSYPTSNQLVSLYFIDEYTGWAVGEYGTIVKTSDGGNTWSLIEIPWLDYLLDIHFPTPNTGYAVGKDGQIIKSTDSGESWNKLSVKYTNNLNRVRFRDEDNGWIIGEKGLILHTIDGGAIWYQQVCDSREDLKGMAIITDSTLCVVGTDSTILISSDDGKNWELVGFEPDSLEFREVIYDFNDVFFNNDSIGWIAGNKLPIGEGVILKTTDSGLHWKEKMQQETLSYSSYCNSGSINLLCGFTDGIQQIYFKDLHRGLCLTDENCRDANVPFYTNNKGKHWTQIIHGCKEYSQKAGRFCFLTNSRVINTCYGGEFRFSYDGGLAWDYPNDSIRILQRIITGHRGRLLALKSSSPGNNYAFSKDFGKSWQFFTPKVFDSTGNPIDIKYTGFTYYFPGFFIDDRETLWIIPYGLGQIFESKDFGLTWYSIRKGINKEYSLTKFLSPDTLIDYYLDVFEVTPKNYASELVFNVSFDGGLTVVSKRFSGLWNDVTPFIDRKKNIFDSYFFNGRTGFLVGSDGNIIKTMNTGHTWISINSGVVEDLHDIEFIDRSVGFVVGKFGRILKTEDGGNTWHKTNSGTQEVIYSIAFKNENEGWVGTENGLRYTNDGGDNWYGVPLRYYHGIVRYIEFDNYGNGYAYTPSPLNKWEDMGVDEIIPRGYTFLLCMKNEGVSVEGNQDSKIYAKTLTLYPNYPNPFNNDTQIVYYQPEAGSVNLKIYNIHGRLVRTLVDRKQKSGRHTVSWNCLSNSGEMATTGVYLYRIKIGNEVKTRKMLLLR